LLQSGAHIEANHIFQSDLGWLLKRDPGTLGADQRNIFEQLTEFIKLQTHQTSRGKQQKRRKK
jgi:hypothetical protein